MLQTILLVDKDPLFAEQMRQFFMNAGFRVLHTRSETEAGDIFSAIKPDLLITDVMLHHPDGGFCLAWQLKRKYPDVPVIMVSSVTWHTDLYFHLNSPGARDWIKAEAYLDKPVRLEELMATVRDVLRLREATHNNPEC